MYVHRSDRRIDERPIWAQRFGSAMKTGIRRVVRP
jgi:hypothetical protein